MGLTRWYASAFRLIHRRPLYSFPVFFLYKNAPKLWIAWISPPPLGGPLRSPPPAPPRFALRPRLTALPPGIPQGFALALRAHPYTSPKGGRKEPPSSRGAAPPLPCPSGSERDPPGKPAVSPARHAGRLPLPFSSSMHWGVGRRTPGEAPAGIGLARTSRW